MRKFPLWDQLRRRPAVAFSHELISRYHSHDIPRQSAALSYYILFALFPILIFISTLLGLLQLDVASILRVLDTVMPRAAVELCGAYLEYVGQTASPSMLWFSLIFSIYFPIRAANCLMRGVRRAYGLEGGVGLFAYYLRLLLYTVSLLLVLAVALVLTTVGQRLLTYFTAHLSFSPYLIELWHYLRFVVLAVFLFAALGLRVLLLRGELRQLLGDLWHLGRGDCAADLALFQLHYAAFGGGAQCHAAGKKNFPKEGT